MSTDDGAPGAKRVGFLELFFDLVFVFAVTQIVGLLHDDHSVAGWGRAGLMLWFVWWAWSQYTWTGNSIDMDRRLSRLVVLSAVGAMLIAATAIPSAYEQDGWWFALPYAAVRLVSLVQYWFGVRHDGAHRAALATYIPIAAVAPLLVVLGAVADGNARIGWWLAALLVDVGSVLAAGRGEFRVDPAHFAERHGLFVIIALGESVIAIGATASDVGLDGNVLLVVGLAYAVVAALWWGYFDWVNAAAEARLAGEPDHRRRSNLARDLFTLGHIPIIAGTVTFAAGAEEALLHPSEPLDSFAAVAVTVGPALYLVGFLLGNLRATDRVLPARTAGVVAVIAIGALAGTRADAPVTIGLIAAVTAAIGAIETIQHSRPPQEA